MATTIDATLLMPGITVEKMNVEKPILLKDEIVYIEGKGFKKGDGVTTLDLLPYMLTGTSQSGQYYFVVQADDTPEVNGQKLREAYAKAKAARAEIEALYGSSGSHYVKIQCMPGRYAWQGTFVLDTSYISIESFTGDIDVIIDGVITFDESKTTLYSLISGIKLPKSSSQVVNKDFFVCKISQGATFRNCAIASPNALGDADKVNNGVYENCNILYGLNGSAGSSITAKDSIIAMSSGALKGKFERVIFGGASPASSNNSTFRNCNSDSIGSFMGSNNEYFFCQGIGVAEAGAIPFQGAGSKAIGCYWLDDGTGNYVAANNTVNI